ncbi:hypothetical protein Tco_0788353 [Tanacetum coccineum]
MSLTAYSDANYAGCQDTRRSTSGSAQFLGDKLVSWSSKKQKSIVISSSEADIALSGCSKHIDLRYHFIKEQVENGIVELYFVWTEYQLADIFTKLLPRERFNFLIEKLGILKNVDYVALLWEDFMYQADNRDISPARKEHKPNVAPKKARKFKKVASPSRKLSPILEEEPVKKPKKAKKPAKKSTIVPTTSVVVRDTPGVFVSKKKAPTKGDRGKGMELLSDAALHKLLMSKQRRLSKKARRILTCFMQVAQVIELVPNQRFSMSHKIRQLVQMKELVLNQGFLIDDVSKGDDDDADSDGDSDNDASDNERTDSDEEENPNLTLKHDEEEETQDDEYVHTSDSYASADEKKQKHAKEGKKTEGSMQSSSVSSDFASKFLNLDNVPPADNEVASMMNDKVSHEESSTQAPLLLTVPVTAIPVTSNVATTTKSKSYRTAEQHKDLYDALVKSYQLNKDLFDSYGKTYSLKRGREDKDKDKDPPARSDQGLKKRKTSKDDEPPKAPKLKRSKSVQAEEPMFETADTEMPQDQGGDLGNTEDQPNVEEASKHDWFKKTERPPTLDPDWNAGKQIDFRPPQTWISKIAKSGKPPLTFDELMSTPIDFLAYVMHNLKIDNLTQQHLVGPTFNLLKGTCKSRVELDYHHEECYKQRKETTVIDYNPRDINLSIFDLRKTLPLVEDPKVVTRVKVMKWYDYRHAASLSPKKISNLERDDLFNLVVALQMFTRRIVILHRIEDLQLGVESYQKKLNITKLETCRSDISKRIPYTAYNNSQGVIYLDKFKMDYLPKRKWCNLDRQRSCIMIKAIDKLRFERRLMRNLEKFVGGRYYETDLRLLERII